MKKRLLIVVVLIILGLTSWQIYLRVSAPVKSSRGRSRASPAVAVETEPVQRTTIRDIGHFTGSVRPKSQFIVAPKIAGRLEKLLVNIGDPVKRNQLIAVLDDAEYRQQVDEAEAELEVARANLEESGSTLEIAHREFERAKALRQKKIASESELDAARAQYRAQKAKRKVGLAKVAQAEAGLKATQVRLSYTQIRASWMDENGLRLVGERFVDEGTMLAPNASIVSILDLHSLTAVIHVIERDYSQVRAGRPAVVTTDAYPGRTFSANVVRVAPLLKETSRQARVELEVPNPEGLLKPGMFVRVKMEFAKHDDATVIAVEALAKRNGRYGVFLVDHEHQKAKFVLVEPGIINSGLVEIVKPSLSGSVVTLGHHLLEDGGRIILPADRSARGTDRRVETRKGKLPLGGRP